MNYLLRHLLIYFLVESTTYWIRMGILFLYTKLFYLFNCSMYDPRDTYSCCYELYMVYLLNYVILMSITSPSSIILCSTNANSQLLPPRNIFIPNEYLALEHQLSHVCSHEIISLSLISLILY